jgi:hypothetical protein
VWFAWGAENDEIEVPKLVDTISDVVDLSLTLSCEKKVSNSSFSVVRSLSLKKEVIFYSKCIPYRNCI